MENAKNVNQTVLITLKPNNVSAKQDFTEDLNALNVMLRAEDVQQEVPTAVQHALEISNFKDSQDNNLASAFAEMQMDKVADF